MVRIANCILLGVALLGGYFSWQASAPYSAAMRENARLVREIGRFEPSDTNRINVQRVDSGKRLEWEWNVYVPPKYKYSIACNTSGGSSTSTRNTSDEQLGRIQMKIRQFQGRWYVWREGIGGSSRFSVSDRTIGDPGKLTIWIPPDDAVAIGPNEACELLRVESQEGDTIFHVAIGDQAATKKLLHGDRSQ